MYISACLYLFSAEVLGVLASLLLLLQGFLDIHVAPSCQVLRTEVAQLVDIRRHLVTHFASTSGVCT